MAAQTNKPAGDARQRRVEMATGIIDRVDIARHLVMAEAVSCRLALALRLLRTTVDDVAVLARIEAEAEAIRRAAAPLPRKPEPARQTMREVPAIGRVAAAALFVAGDFVVRWL